MPSPKRLDQQLSAHHHAPLNRCTYSPCCGAPVNAGGICSECRERCLDPDDEPELLARPLSHRAALAEPADDSSTAFEAIVLRLIRA